MAAQGLDQHAIAGVQGQCSGMCMQRWAICFATAGNSRMPAPWQATAACQQPILLTAIDGGNHAAAVLVHLAHDAVAPPHEGHLLALCNGLQYSNPSKRALMRRKIRGSRLHPEFNSMPCALATAQGMLQSVSLASPSLCLEPCRHPAGGAGIHGYCLH